MPKRPPYADSKTTESGLGIAIRSFTYSTNPPTSKDTHTHAKKGPKTPHHQHHDIRAGSYVRCLPVGRTDLPRRSDRAARPRTVLPPAGRLCGRVLVGNGPTVSRFGQWRTGQAWTRSSALSTEHFIRVMLPFASQQCRSRSSSSTCNASQRTRLEPTS